MNIVVLNKVTTKIPILTLTKTKWENFLIPNYMRMIGIYVDVCWLHVTKAIFCRELRWFGLCLSEFAILIELQTRTEKLLESEWGKRETPLGLVEVIWICRVGLDEFRWVRMNRARIPIPVIFWQYHPNHLDKSEFFQYSGSVHVEAKKNRLRWELC